MLQGSPSSWPSMPPRPRRDAIVERALAKDHAAVIVLGAANDLTDNIRGVFGEGCEYIKVTGHAVREYSGEARK